MCFRAAAMGSGFRRNEGGGRYGVWLGTAREIPANAGMTGVGAGMTGRGHPLRGGYPPPYPPTEGGGNPDGFRLSPE